MIRWGAWPRRAQRIPPMAISHRRPFIIDQDTFEFRITIPTGNDNMVRDEGPIRDADLCSVPRPEPS